MKKFLVAAMALAMLAGSATTALAGHETVGTSKGANQCASHAHGLNLGQSAAAAGPTSIDVSWNDYCDEETDFHVWRSATSDGVFTSVGTTAGGADKVGENLSYNDTLLTCETTYYYKLQAHKHGNSNNGGGEQLSFSAVFSGTTGACPAEGRAAPAIANEYLRSAGGAATAAACEAKYEGSNNWHGEVISAVAQSELQGQTFTAAQESVVTTWVDTHCVS